MKASDFDFAAALKGQFERAQRTKDALPYFLLTRGPTPKCPIHGNNENLVLSVDHPYWKTFQPRSIPDCKCRIRQVSFIEFERLLRDGYQDPDAPPIRDDKGLMTGHREKRTIPIKTVPFIFLLVLLSYPLSAFAAHLHKEKEYQEAWCKAAGGVTEYVLDDGTRVDCLTDEYAIEFDFAPKWSEAAGQALFYGIKTGRKSGVVLIMEGGEGDARYLTRLKEIASRYELKIWQQTP